MSTPTPTLTGAYTCTHHNDRERAACPVCLVATLTAERDQLRVDLELADVMYQRECEVEHELRTEVERLRSDRDCEKRLRKDADEFRENAIARAMKAEADLAALGESFDDNCRQIVKIADELAAERARLDYLLQWDVTFHDRADIDAELSYAHRKKSTPTLP